MKTLSYHLALALTLTILTSGCAVSDGDETPTTTSDLGTVSQALSNPATVTTGGWCLNKRTTYGVRTRLYYPPSGGCSGMAYSPLVVLLPGYTYDITEYHELLKHLARNGIASVALDVYGDDAYSHSTAVTEAMDVLTWVRTNWSKATFIDRTNVAIIGHSRGGGTAPELAAAMQAPGQPWDVRAIVRMAPVNHQPVELSIAPAVMHLHGTSDHDETAENSYELYAQSATESSVFGNAVERVMKVVVGGSHSMWTSSNSASAHIPKGYVLAFLKAHLQSDYSWYDTYIRGDRVPTGDYSPSVYPQFSSGILRGLVDDLERTTVSPGPLGAVVPYGATASITNLANASYTDHQTRALRLYPTVSNANVRWTLPGTDARWYAALSLRIGLEGTAPVDDVWIRVRNGSTWSSSIRLSEHGTIAQPTWSCVQPGPVGCLGFGTRVHMSTVRIPLSAFGELADLDDIEQIELLLGSDAYHQGLLIDSLEFADWVTSP